MNEQERSLLAEMVAEQRKTNSLLLMLIEALGDDESEEGEATHYMDGTPVAK